MTWWVDLIDARRVIDDKGNLIAKARDARHTAMISAAPDLLKALEGLLDRVFADSDIEEARAAIAKAKGETE